jgi:hypothetical protein
LSWSCCTRVSNASTKGNAKRYVFVVLVGEVAEVGDGVEELAGAAGVVAQEGFHAVVLGHAGTR